MEIQNLSVRTSLGLIGITSLAVLFAVVAMKLALSPSSVRVITRPIVLLLLLWVGVIGGCQA